MLPKKSFKVKLTLDFQLLHKNWQTRQHPTATTMPEMFVTWCHDSTCLLKASYDQLMQK
jgi:hypothetical protein